VGGKKFECGKLLQKSRMGLQTERVECFSGSEGLKRREKELANIKKDKCEKGGFNPQKDKRGGGSERSFVKQDNDPPNQGTRLDGGNKCQEGLKKDSTWKCVRGYIVLKGKLSSKILREED